LTFSEERLEQLFEAIRKTRLAVIGDLMLDSYVWGLVERISPEAPVPIVTLTGESTNLGGAANVAANVASLGAAVSVVGVVGADREGDHLRELVRKSGFSDDGVTSDPNRPTSVKTRVIAQNQHVVRIDRERTTPLSAEMEDALLKRIADILPTVNAVILEDYNKGVLTPRVIRTVISECRSKGILVGVDPKKENFWEYKGATLFKPNLREIETGVGRRLASDEELTEAGRDLRTKMDFEYLLVTRGEQGMALFTDEGVKLIPTKAHRVHDVSGAGDTVIATIMTTLVGGADINEAAAIANHAASIVIAEIGAAPVDAGELRRVCLGR